MLDRLSRLPRVYFVVMLALSVALLVALAYFFFMDQDTPVAELPSAYWLGLALMLASLFGFTLSLHFLWHAPNQTLTSGIAGIATIGLLALLCRIGSEGWRGGTVGLAATAVVFYSLAIIFRLLERRSKTTSLTTHDNPETTR
jgi:hypothetical protein